MCVFVGVEVFCCIPLVHDMRHSGSDGERRETNMMDAVRFQDGGPRLKKKRGLML